jgi:aflatoxin B1 aldehyde reductase
VGQAFVPTIRQAFKLRTLQDSKHHPESLENDSEHSIQLILPSPKMPLKFGNLSISTGPLVSSAASTYSTASDTSDETAFTEFSSRDVSRVSSSVSSGGNANQRPALRIILGTASIGSAAVPMAKITTVEDTSDFLNTFRSRGYVDIDTARAYPVGRGGSCEKLLGSKELEVGTKVQSFMPGSHRPKNIAASIDKSLEALNLENVDIMYLHAPDRATPFKDTLAAMNKAHQAGKYERFGLSNFSAAEVKEVIEICQENNFVMPAVYQGQYNAICRNGEEELLPTLRKHDIAFYAYSPSACGFFSGKVTRATSGVSGSRWDSKSPLGAKYSNDYFHDPMFTAGEMVRQHALQYGIDGHAIGLRWIVWHSQLDARCGDGVIIGASSVKQLEENLGILEQGPLPNQLVHVIGKAWNIVKDVDNGPKYNMSA